MTEENQSEVKEWEKPWNPVDLVNNSKTWSLAGDSGLLLYLKQFSENLISKAIAIEKNLQSLEHEEEQCFTKFENSTTNFLMLENTQFIENRVYEEEIPGLKKEDKAAEKQEKTKEEKEQELFAVVNEALKIGMSVMDNYFDKLDSRELKKNDDSDEDEEENFTDAQANLEDLIIYESKDPYVLRSLPYLIGSPEYLENDHVGLKDLDSDDEEEEEVDEQQSVHEEEEEEDDEDEYEEEKVIDQTMEDSDEDESDQELFQKPADSHPSAVKSDKKTKKKSDNLFDDSDEEEDEDDKGIFVRTTKTKAGLFDDDDEDEEENTQSKQKTKKDDNLFDSQSNGEGNEKIKQESESIFGDEEEKEPAPIEKPAKKQPLDFASELSMRLAAKAKAKSPESKAADEPSPTPPPPPPPTVTKPKEEVKSKPSLFVDDDAGGDDESDIFSAKKPTPVPAKTAPKSAKSLFDESDSEDNSPDNELFKAPVKTTTPSKPPAQLKFDSSEEENIPKPIPKIPAASATAQPKVDSKPTNKKSLFDSEDEDEDDFFSKPLPSKTTPAPAPSSAQTPAPKPVEATASQQSVPPKPVGPAPPPVPAKDKKKVSLFDEDDDEDDLFSGKIVPTSFVPPPAAPAKVEKVEPKQPNPPKPEPQKVENPAPEAVKRPEKKSILDSSSDDDDDENDLFKSKPAIKTPANQKSNLSDIFAASKPTKNPADAPVKVTKSLFDDNDDDFDKEPVRKETVKPAETQKIVDNPLPSDELPELPEVEEDIKVKPTAKANIPKPVLFDPKGLKNSSLFKKIAQISKSNNDSDSESNDDDDMKNILKEEEKKVEVSSKPQPPLVDTVKLPPPAESVKLPPLVETVKPPPLLSETPTRKSSQGPKEQIKSDQDDLFSTQTESITPNEFLSAQKDRIRASNSKKRAPTQLRKKLVDEPDLFSSPMNESKIEKPKITEPPKIAEIKTDNPKVTQIQNEPAKITETKNEPPKISEIKTEAPKEVQKNEPPKIEPEPKKLVPEPSSMFLPPDDIIPAKPQTKSLFGDDDDDIFKIDLKPKPKETKESKVDSKPKDNIFASLDENEDDIFQIKSNPLTTKKVEKPKTSQESFAAAALISAPPDDDLFDEDIFSIKPKTVKSSAKSSAAAKDKDIESIFDDPLNLFNK